MKENLIIIIIVGLMLFIVAVSNSYDGQQGERERIKDAIVNNPNITCVEYLKIEEESDEKN